MKSAILADNNYFGEDNLRAAAERDIEAVIPDGAYKKRLCGETEKQHYSADDFKYHTEEYQEQYANRIGIIKPVFSDIGYCKGLDRFTLRGKEKVNAQWQLYCMAHNLGKILKAYNEMRCYG